MNKNILHILFFGCFIFCNVFNAFTQSEKHFIREGNNQFKDATIDPKKTDSLKFKNAENSYKNALDEKPDSYEATYNLGNAYYRQKNFKDAITQYKIAANKQMPKNEQAWNFHNMGNTLLQSGQLQESIDAYKSSLKNNPRDKETKYNLAYAQYLLKKQQQQKQDNKDQNKDENKDQQKKDQKQDQKDKQDQQKQDQKQDQQDQKQAQKKDQISKEDAQRMLEAMQNDEKKTQEKLKKQQVKAQRIKIEKDW